VQALLAERDTAQKRIDDLVAENAALQQQSEGRMEVGKDLNVAVMIIQMPMQQLTVIDKTSSRLISTSDHSESLLEDDCFLFLRWIEVTRFAISICYNSFN
jgi:broad-specificity NMP kinase